MKNKRTSKKQMDFNSRPLKIFFGYYKPHVHLFVFDMICAVLIAAIDVAFPLLTKIILDSIIPNKNIRQFVILLVILLAGYGLRWLCNWFVGYWGHIFGNRVEQDMRRDVFMHLEKQSFSFFDTHRTGKLMANATSDLFEVTELAHHGPEDFFIAVLTLLGSAVLLVKIRWELALVVFVALPIFLTITILSRRKFSSTSKDVKDKTAQINAELESCISGIRVTQSFTNEPYEINNFNKANKEYGDSKEYRFKCMATFHSNIDFCNNILGLLVLALGGYFIMNHKMQLSDLVAANLYIASFTRPIRQLTNFVEQFTTGMAGFNRFLEIMRTHTEIPDLPDAAEISSVHGDINFNNVSFHYTKDFPVLQNVNLSIKAGQKYALVGSSGGGKTTICNLIPRFYEATGGSITLDGTDITKIKLSSLRSKIGIVQQDVFLFAGTVKQNIAYGRPDATDEEIIEAAKQAEIHEDILKMPNGYDTIVGERGIKLSGGQKQRVSIARCFLKNPPVLILDEATSALDSATEIKIQSAFDKLSSGRTTIVIAHRLSTIKNADQISVVDDKGIIETGTHNQLMEARGEYFKLIQSQNS